MDTDMAMDTRASLFSIICSHTNTNTNTQHTHTGAEEEEEENRKTIPLQ